MTAKRISFVLLALLIGTFYQAEAQTINAASCNSADVQAAFNAVTNSTTTVNIPAGTCTWTGSVTLTVPSGNTLLSVFGAGNLTTVGGGDVTVIVDNSTSGNPLLTISTNSSSTAYFRLAGITFEGGSGAVKYNGIIGVYGSSANVRVDHIHINTTTYSPGETSAGVHFGGCIFGVTDHSIFDNSSGSVNNSTHEDNGQTCFGDTLGVGDQSWAHSTSLGSASFMFMENNVFNSGVGNDCTFGGRFVARFNTFNMPTPGPSLQTHPTGGGGRIRGCRAWEIYQNQFDAIAGSYVNTGFWMSSGTGVVWGNTFPSSSTGGGTGYRNAIQALDMRANSTTYSQTAPPAGWGYCGTAKTGSASNWDGNTNSSGYPCLDQPARGVGDLLQGGFTSDGSGSNNVCDVTSGQCAAGNYNGSWPNEALEPLYEWTDNYSPVPDNPSDVFSASAGSFTQNQDYYLWCNASAYNTGCTTFNGTAGVGSGTLASRPSTCTTGVAYWATDQGNWNQSGSGGQGELFKCTATNTWTLFYTPYTYPHPLTATTSKSTGPSAPSGLQAVFN